MPATNAPPCECHNEPMFFKPRSDGGKGSWLCAVKRRDATRKSRERSREVKRRSQAKSIMVKHWYDERDCAVAGCVSSITDHVHHIGPIPWCERCQEERR